MPKCKERKQLLGGGEQSFDCELVRLVERHSILKYTIHRERMVGTLKLAPGTVTFGFYWTDRPYTLYKWLSSSVVELGNYFNVADSVRLSPDQVVWRDLFLDVLVLPSGQVEVLDEDEIPGNVDNGILDYIAASKHLILSRNKEIIKSTTFELLQLKLLN